MIDKLDLRVPSILPFRREFRDFESELRLTGSVSGIPGSQHYRAVADLRKRGVPAILHLGNKHTPEANHKIEIIDAGQMAYSQMLGTVEQIIDADPLSLSVMRIDPVADIEGIPVGWFKQHARVQYLPIMTVFRSSYSAENRLAVASKPSIAASGRISFAFTTRSPNGSGSINKSGGKSRENAGSSLGVP